MKVLRQVAAKADRSVRLLKQTCAAAREVEGVKLAANEYKKGNEKQPQTTIHMYTDDTV